MDPALRAGVEGALGAPVPQTRVHRDERAQAGAAAIGARAFAHKADIYLGLGESPDDRALMSHELTHVAQQAGDAISVQGKIVVGAPGTPAEQQADAIATSVTAGASCPAVLVDDDAPTLAPGQMRVRDFIATLQPILTLAASEELGPLWSAAGCPYIAEYLGAYSQRSAREGEAFIRRFTRSTATTAADLIPDMIARVRTGVRYWRDTGKPPPEAAAADPQAAAATVAAGPAVAGGGAQLARVDGAPLDGAIAAAAGDVLGAQMSHVRVHTGEAGDRVARRHDALAVTVGRDIAFRGGAYQPGTPAGEALIAHEVGHVAQQQGAEHSAPASTEHDDEAEADMAAVGVLGRLWGGTVGRFARAKSAGQVEHKGLALRRCSTGATPAKVLEKARYTEIETRLTTLVARKRALVHGGRGNMAAIDAQLDRLIAELRTDFGVRLEKGEILEAAVAHKDMLVVDGRIVMSPSGTEHFMGERLGFKLEVDHVPPGEGLQVAWRYRTDPSGAESRFLLTGPAFAKKTKSLEMELDTLFWGVRPHGVDQARGMEVIAHIYVGEVDQPTRTFSTGFIAMPERPVGDIKVVGAPAKVVAGQYLELGIGPWTPDFRTHTIDWFVDDALVAEDRLGMRRKFSDVGTHRVRAAVSNLRRSLGIHDKAPLKSAEASFEVMTADAFGASFLDELETSPFRPKPVALGQLVESGDTSSGEIRHHIDQGGSQQAYWKERLKAQNERMAKLKELAPDYATSKPLPPIPPSSSRARTADRSPPRS